MFMFIRLFFSIDIPMLSGISINMFTIWLLLFIFGISTTLINKILNTGLNHANNDLFKPRKKSKE